MEKRVPHCDLDVVHTLIAEGRVRSTVRASLSASKLKCDFDDTVAVVLALTVNDFYKSMTTHIDDSVWQDVYRPSTKYGALYVKLTVINDVLIVSFKRL